MFNDFRTAYLIGSGPRGNPVRDGLKTNFLLKIIPHVDGSSRICKLVEYHLEDIELEGAWTGPGALDLHAHALPLSPSCRCSSDLGDAHHCRLDLALGKAVYDYLRQPAERSFQTAEMSYAS